MTLRYDLVDRFVDVGKMRVRYLEAGQGRPLVLLHGLAVQNASTQWLTNFDVLTKVAHVYALDLPGWGLSDFPESFTFPMWTETVRGFFDALNIEEADVMGQSLGGWIAALFTSENPERVRRLVWLAQAGMNPVAPQNSASFHLPAREALARQYATEALGNSIYDEMVSRPEREVRYRELLDYINAPEVRDTYTMRTRLPSMQMPILFGQGDSNRAIPVEYALEGFRLAPLGRLAVVVGGSAPGGYNSPELVDAAIRFLQADEITPA